MPFRREKSGAEGFFEEIPSLIVVIIGMSIFFASAFNFYAVHLSASARKDLTDENMHIMRCVISLSNISHKDALGRPTYGFSSVLLNNFTTDEMREIITTEMKYNVTVEDMKTEEVWSFGDDSKNASEEKSSLSKPIPVYYEDECHPGKITVLVWK